MIIRRTLVYGVVTAGLAGLYFGIVLALQQVFSSFAGGSDLADRRLDARRRRAVPAGAPRVQRVVDRRFYRRRYDAQRTLEAFSAACARRSTSTRCAASSRPSSTRRCSRRTGLALAAGASRMSTRARSQARPPCCCLVTVSARRSASSPLVVLLDARRVVRARRSLTAVSPDILLVLTFASSAGS